jgi:hypothetical protein
MIDDEENIIKRTRPYTELYEKLTNLKKKLKPKIYKKRLPYQQQCTKQKKKFMNELKNVINENAEVLCNSAGLAINRVKLTEKNHNEMNDEIINMFVVKQNKDRINKSIYWKDKNLVSDETYQSAISFLGIRAPPLEHVRREKKKVNSEIKVFENRLGVYVSVREKVQKVLEKVISKCKIKRNKIRIKFAGDGTNTARHQSLLAMSFCILNEGKKARTASGTYIVGLFDICESYEEIEEAVAELEEEMKNLTDIEINGQKYFIEQYLGGDLKFLALVTGIMQANSNFPCVSCKYETGTTCKDNVQENNKEFEWSMLDPNWARTTQEASEVASNETKKIQFCQKNRPIFAHIPIKRIVFDLLHLFLRICDKLKDLLYSNLILADEKEKNIRDEQIRKNKQREKDLKNNLSVGDLQKPITLTNYQVKFALFLTEECKISKPTYFNKEKKKVLVRDLRGGEYKKVMEKFNLTILFPNLEKAKLIDEIWNGFYTIIKLLKDDEKKYESTKLKTDTKSWLINYLDVYDTSDVTPYIHTFVYHLHELQLLYGNVNEFNMEGLEKKNGILKSQYFGATNRHKKSYLVQLINQQNRLDLLSQLGDGYVINN